MQRTRLETKVCKIIREKRKPRGKPEATIPQTTLCELLGISQATLSKIENMETVPSLDAWLKFCRLFKLHPDPALWA